MTHGRLLFVMLAAALALSACGKRADLRAPDGEAGAYTYPKVYPNPSTVLPASSGTTKLKSREVTSGAGDLSPLPNSRKKTSYGNPSIQ